MASLTVKLFKGWEQFAAATDPRRFRRSLAQRMGRATRENCIDVRQEIRRRIDAGSYVKNSGLTILLKGSSKPLVGGNAGIGSELGGGNDPGGTMLKRLDYTTDGPYVGYIGVVRNRAGHNIALILHQYHEEGFVLRMTPKRQKWLAMAIRSAMKKQGMDYSRRGQAYSHSGGKATPISGSSSHLGSSVMIIPARPFIRQAMQDPALQQRIIDRWGKAAAAALRVT